jgi:hypothetical protein
MSTPAEQKRQFEILSKKYESLGQRAKWMQSGYEDVRDGTAIIRSHHPEFSHSKAKRLAKQGRVAEFSDDPGDGWLPRYPQDGDGDPNDDSKNEVTGALAYVQKAIDALGDSNRDLVNDLNAWASTANTLLKGSGNTVRKAVPNTSGSTRGPVVYPQNRDSSSAGPGKSVLTSELSKIVSDAEKLSKLTSRITQVHNL